VSRGELDGEVEFEIPSDFDRQRMSVVVRLADGRRMLETKGATEAAVETCRVAGIRPRPWRSPGNWAGRAVTGAELDGQDDA